MSMSGNDILKAQGFPVDEDWESRILDSAQTLALDLVTENFKRGRVAGLVKRDAISVDEIAESFKGALERIIQSQIEDGEYI